MTRGIVIGKFYPFHKGHAHLISEASKFVDQLEIIVCHRADQTISGGLRAQWIREEFPQHKVIVINDVGSEDDSEYWADYTIEQIGYKPDLVCSGEFYGEAYAKYLGAEHITIKRDLKSGRRTRLNPYKYWDDLTDPAKAYYTKRICLVGAESTGTTTLSKALAEKYKTTWVPEVGRFYYEGKMKTKNAEKWKTREFLFIANQQNKLEDELAKKSNKLLFCDTNSLATALWHERFVGVWSEEVEKYSDNRTYELYVLTDTDIPFEQDGTRSNEDVRKRMHQRFIEVLSERKLNFIIASGSIEDRVRQVSEKINFDDVSLS